MAYWHLSNKLVKRRRSTFLEKFGRSNLRQMVLKDSALVGKYTNKKYIIEMVVSKGDCNFYLLSTGKTLREAFKDFRFRFRHTTDIDYLKTIARLQGDQKTHAIGSIKYDSQEQEYMIKVNSTGYDREDWRLLKEDGAFVRPKPESWDW